MASGVFALQPPNHGLYTLLELMERRNYSPSSMPLYVWCIVVYMRTAPKPSTLMPLLPCSDCSVFRFVVMVPLSSDVGSSVLMIFLSPLALPFMLQSLCLLQRKPLGHLDTLFLFERASSFLSSFCQPVCAILTLLTIAPPLLGLDWMSKLPLYFPYCNVILSNKSIPLFSLLTPLRISIIMLIIIPAHL